MRAGLEWAEQTFGMRDAAAGVLDANYHTLAFGAGGNFERANGLIEHGALAILGEIEEDLHQALAVGPDGGQSGLDVPCELRYPLRAGPAR